ncbi:hypothetical protein CP8484711_1237A, partial [Chlamydia psittaci 84-8471/1]
MDNVESRLSLKKQDRFVLDYLQT